MIEPALKEDVHEIVPLLRAAIGDIAYTLAGTSGDEADEADEAETDRILGEFFVQEGNRLSYTHVLVDRREDGVAGMLLCYSGNGAAALDTPFLPRAGAGDGTRSIVTEAQEGDYYLDSIAVAERYQGQGVARQLIAAFEQKGAAAGMSRLSLIVEPGNARAEALYRKLGYTEDGGLLVSGSRYIRMIKPV